MKNVAAQPSPMPTSSLPKEPPRCGRCNYDLAGLLDRTHCPECGDPIRQPGMPQPWLHLLLRKRRRMVASTFILCVGQLIATLACVLYAVTMFSPSGSPFGRGITNPGSIGCIAAIVSLLGLFRVYGGEAGFDVPSGVRSQHTEAASSTIFAAGSMIFAFVLVYSTQYAPRRGAQLFGRLWGIVSFDQIVTLAAAVVSLSLCFVATYYNARWLLRAIRVLNDQPRSENERRQLKLLLLGPPGAAMLMGIVCIQLITAKQQPRGRSP